MRRSAGHRQPRRGGDAAGRAAASSPRSSARRRFWSRTKAGCRPARSRRAALAMAVSMAKALGVAHMAMPTNGNAGAALAAYASRAGIRTTVVLPGGHAGGERQRDRAAGRDRLPGQRPDRRLRQDRRRGQGQGRLVRHLDAQGALPDRGQEDDGARARRAARLGGARRDPLSDRRRHRPDRHVEGVRRAGGDRLHRQASARAWWRCRPRAARRWCAPSRRAWSTRRAGRTRTPSRPASGCRRRSAIS